MPTALGGGAEAALEALRGLGWQVKAAGRRRPLPAQIRKRYPAIPDDVRAFLEELGVCARGDDRVWFLTAGDYAKSDVAGFRWDEWERMELEWAGAEEQAGVRAFWDAHLPILQAVEGDYAHLSVVVDPSAANYGAVVRGDSPEFTETVPVSGSFAELLAMISASGPGSAPDRLFDLILPAQDESRLASAPLGPLGRVARILRSWRPFESYRVGLVFHETAERSLYAGETWAQITPFMSALVRKLDAEAFVGRLPWNEASDRLTDPAVTGQGAVRRAEVWAPSRSESYESGRGPEMVCLIERNEADGSQGVVLAVRKDVLPKVDVAADEVIFEIRDACGLGACKVFDRTWGESGRFGSPRAGKGLDLGNAHDLLAWATDHPKASRPSFRWRRSYGPPNRYR